MFEKLTRRMTVALAYGRKGWYMKDTTEQDMQALKDQQAVDDARILRTKDEVDAVNAADSASMSLVNHETHVWKRGILPGQKYIKTCSIGGEIVNIEFPEWQNLA